MKQSRYHVIVSGTEFYLDVEQVAGSQASCVPMITKQNGYEGWRQCARSYHAYNPISKKK